MNEETRILSDTVYIGYVGQEGKRQEPGEISKKLENHLGELEVWVNKGMEARNRHIASGGGAWWRINNCAEHYFEAIADQDPQVPYTAELAPNFAPPHQFFTAEYTTGAIARGIKRNPSLLRGIGPKFHFWKQLRKEYSVIRINFTSLEDDDYWYITGDISLLNTRTHTYLFVGTLIYRVIKKTGDLDTKDWYISFSPSEEVEENINKWPEQVRDLGDKERVKDLQGVIRMACAELCNPGIIAIGWKHCRNIELVDEKMTERQRLIKEKNGEVIYKVLRVPKEKKRYKYTAKNVQRDVIRLHRRGGSWATYTEDAPLFGKYTGTFWRPETWVGRKKRGVVVKEYELE